MMDVPVNDEYSERSENWESSLFISAAKLYQPCLKHACEPFTQHETNNIITCIIRIIIIITGTFNYFFEFDDTYTYSKNCLIRHLLNLFYCVI